MKFPQRAEAITSLSEMEEELNSMGEEAGSFLSEIDEMSPDEYDYSDAEMNDEEKEAADKIETPEDAKKVLDTCKNDLQKVIDSLDGLSGQVKEEISEASHKRWNDKYASSLITLAEQTDRAINDAKDAMKYWGFLKKAKKVTTSESAISPLPGSDSIDQVFANVEKSLSYVDKFAKLLGYKKIQEVSGKTIDATAVPPTGAEFSGDKWPGNKNTAEVELRHWRDGASKYDRDKSFEDARPNSAVDNRLTSVDYQRNDAPYVNASFRFNKENKYSSYWEVVDTKSGKVVIADFANVPASIGKKNEESFKQFSSKQYGKTIIDHVLSAGIESVAKSLGGIVSALNDNTLKVVAADKSSLRSYYTDAFGDAGYASELVTGDKQGMDIGYTPKDDSVATKDTSTKDGTGKLSNNKEDPQVLLAKSRQAIILARKLASRGAIPFVKGVILQRAEELMELSEEEFAATENAIEEIPVVNEAALIVAHIPDTEIGIVGNKSEGVRDQSAQVKTEAIDSGVKSDAHVTKTSNIVPQIFSEDNKNQVNFKFNTVVERLKAKGITPEKLRVAKRV